MQRHESELRAELARLEREHLLRQRHTLGSFPEAGSRIAISLGGRPVIDFSSNDYLGLARHPDVAQAMEDCARKCGSGSGASHLVSGHGSEHVQLEEQLASFTGRERALLFSTGYMANLAVLTTLVERGERVLLDRLSHASLIDGARLSGARLKRYPHAQAAAAAALMSEGSVAMVATEGVFSMDGDLGPLAALAASCRRNRAWLLVDDAHGIGVLGAHGRGSLEHFGLNTDEVPLLMGTLGKAFGSFGAFVAGANDVIELLLQKARTFIYTTALPQPVAAATRKALELSERESWRRARVLSLAARFRSAAQQLNIPLPETNCITPIQPVLLGDAERALIAQRQLLEAGFLVIAIRPPTVPRGTSRLRVSLSAAHSQEQVDRLIEALHRSCAQPVGTLRSGAQSSAHPPP